MNSVIFLFSSLDVNIQIRGQDENWDLMKEFSTVFLWKGDVNFVILASALSFWLAFLQIFFKWLLKVSLLSIVMPSIFSSDTFLIVMLS